MRRTLARRIKLLGEAERRAEADAKLLAPGDAVIVRRGVLRALVLRCPDGCGDILSVNLDPRMDKAWRLLHRKRGLTLYPSVWRDGGCQSHFVVWDDRILWCEADDARDNIDPPYDERLEERLLKALRAETFMHAQDLAEEIGESAWDVARTGHRLVAHKRARCGTGDRRDWFAAMRTAGVE